jgi:RNA polymerase sigma factor (sigma-70 family)
VLLQEAVAGSGAAFAALYDRYESRVFNFCLRLVDSREDARDATQEAFLSVLRRLRNDDDPVLNFSAYLFAAARHEAYEVGKRRARTDLVAEPPEPRGAVAGPSAIEADPERSALLQSSQDEVRAANARLPRRHREVLALRELEGCSYDEIAEILCTNRNAVSQLIWRARVRLRAELRIGAVASVVAASEACERAQALLSRQQDGELDELDRAWLKRHLDECGACRTSKAALLEVGTSYRAWLPVAAFAGMRPDVLTRAGEIVGADWSAVASSGSGSAAPGAASGHFAAGVAAVAAAGAAALALVVLLPDEEDRPPAAERSPPPTSQNAPKPEAAKRNAAGAAKRRAPGAADAARRPEATPRPARESTASPPESPQGAGPPSDGPPGEPPARPPQTEPPGPDAPGRQPPASPPVAAPPGRPAPGSESPESPPAEPQAPEVTLTPETPSTPAEPPATSNCTQSHQGRGTDGCPPGHGGEPPGRKGEGGRGPPPEPPGRP